MENKNQSENFIDNKKFFEMFQELQSTVNQIFAELNNGLKTNVKNNTKSIDNLKKEVENLKKEIKKDKDEKKGKAKLKENLGWYFSAILFILGTLAYLGVI